MPFETDVEEGEFLGYRIYRIPIPFLCLHLQYDPPTDEVGDTGEFQFGIQRDLILMVHRVVREEFQEGVSVENNHSVGHTIPR